MSELIDRAALMDSITAVSEQAQWRSMSGFEAYNAMLEIINSAPTVYGVYQPVTTLEMREIRRRLEAGETTTSIAAAVGRSASCIKNIKQRAGIKGYRKGGRPENTYIVREKSTEEMIVCGNAKKCAEKLGVSVRSFRTAANYGPGKRRKWVVEKMEGS